MQVFLLVLLVSIGIINSLPEKIGPKMTYFVSQEGH